jgi:hypothetical protein
LAIAAIVVLPFILSPIGLGSLTETLTRIARWPVLLIVLLIGLPMPAITTLDLAGNTAAHIDGVIINITIVSGAKVP